jgi:hypothetical protein
VVLPNSGISWMERRVLLSVKKFIKCHTVNFGQMQE